MTAKYRVFLFPYLLGLAKHSRNPDLYLEDFIKTKTANDACNFDGMLFFTSLGDTFDQWSLGPVLAENTKQIPVFAVLPYWEHPIITARKIVCFQKIYKRPIGINWITGIGLKDQQKIGIQLTKEERYERLGEYIELVNLLLTERVNHFDGKYYQVKDHALSMKSDLPVYQYISGSSESCVKLLQKFPFLNHVSMGMNPGYQYASTVRGTGMGIITRPTDAEALEVFHQTFPIEKKNELYMDLAKKNTDSKWKEELYKFADSSEGKDGFFSSCLKGYTELGFFVGSYEKTAAYLKEMLDKDIRTFFINLTEFHDAYHLKKAFDLT